MPYRLFPYERRLGLRELERLGLIVLQEADGEVLVAGEVARAIDRATYFDHVAVYGHEPWLTQQSFVEAEHMQLRSANLRRQATRYGLHGIHEYKGKFNPQLVRALTNVVDPDAQTLIDPFCGSGTAPLEGLRLGMSVVGIDQSPIAWFLAAAKLEAAVATDKVRLAEDLLRVGERVAVVLDHGQSTVTEKHLDPVLGQATAEYLRSWFPPAAFAGLSGALAHLHGQEGSTAQKLSLVALSAVLRSVSLQMPEDLRIRRRAEPFVAPPIAPLFSEAISSIRQGLTEMAAWDEVTGSAAIVRGSTDDVTAYRAAAGSRRRLILTSPPYATALPYIDTDRLSILALGLAEAPALMPLERQLLGSREWRRAEQIRWDERRVGNLDGLPAAITGLLTHIDDRNTAGDAGFRRRALPALLYRYFAGMGRAFDTWRDVLSRGERAVVIVGHNRTTAGDERVDIATPELLGDVATSRGFDVAELIHLETWPRYGMHSANGVSGEDALVLERTR